MIFNGTLVIPEIKKIVFVNDEEGNATFVVHQAESDRQQIFSRLTKEQLKGLIPCGLVSELDWPGNPTEWKAKIIQLIQEKPEIKSGYAIPTTPPERHERAPEGWMTNGGLAEKIGVGFSTVGLMVQKYRSDHPEWFKEYLDTIGKLRTHYSPQLVAKIQEEFAKYELAPEGWMTKSGLSKKFKAGKLTIVKIADQHHKTHPEWFKEYLDATHKIATHYSPKLVAKIRGELANREFAPEGWMTKGSLKKEFKAGELTIAKIADQHRKDHPEWFKECLDTIGISRTHYSPQLVAIIEAKLGRRR